MIDDFCKRYKPFSDEAFAHVRPLADYTREQEEEEERIRKWSHDHIEDYQLTFEEMATICD